MKLESIKSKKKNGKLYSESKEWTNETVNPPTAEGFVGEGVGILDDLWHLAQARNAGSSELNMEHCSKALNWNVRIQMWSPTFFTGWRLYIKKLSDWLYKIASNGV